MWSGYENRTRMASLEGRGRSAQRRDFRWGGMLVNYRS
jgi:hypothetical protein